ncbi:hypothetical protein [Cystobacter fuscus]|uniref:hypothetical protein n=1 Tax=Cystobacter fuscus TaxID=43 RepID=UPI002B281DD0|nr:hypothetical protein F0U63_25465 [Cystobacter fuscus]
MKTFNLLLMVTALGGCVHRVPIVLEAPKCMPEVTMPSCATPVPLEEGSTYSALLADYQTDRQSLQRCALEHDYLLKAISTCNSVIDEYNQKVTSQQGGKSR